MYTIHGKNFQVNRTLEDSIHVKACLGDLPEAKIARVILDSSITCTAGLNVKSPPLDDLKRAQIHADTVREEAHRRRH